jgi:hypothetical protein
MAITIKPNSAHVTITGRPTLNTPAPSGPNMSFSGTQITAAGDVTLNGSPGDSAAGWTLGFIQVQWIETNWVHYRGQHNNDGSIFLQRARPPARAHQACRDCVDGSPVNRVFYSVNPAHGEIATGGAGATFPLRLAVTHFDQPSDDCTMVETNTLTTRPNFLREVQLEFAFATILSVQDPAGRFHHQKFFYWNTRWQTTFDAVTFTVPTPNLTPPVVAADTGATVSNVMDGAPNDRRFNDVVISNQTLTCNGVFRAARAALASATSPNRHEAKTWHNFDVTKP